MSKADIEIDNCLCGNKTNIKSCFIKGVANRKNYFVKCEKCKTRTRRRKTPYKAIEEWNKYKGDLFLKERKGYKMSKADEMFKKLGYEKIKETDCWTSYKNKLYIISFEKYSIEIFIESIGDTCSPELNYISIVTIETLQAINEKCKELRVE